MDETALAAKASPLNETISTLLQRYGITHCANIMARNFVRYENVLFEGPMHDLGGRGPFKIWRCDGLQAAGHEADRSDWFWERMEPHLERQAGGVGLVVDGRAAQAFARDCTPDERAAWTWGAGQEETVFTPWTKTSIGYCTSIIVLPHDALPPVRVATMKMDEYLANRVGERRPAIRSGFDVYFVENRLIYVKEPCGQDDVDARFFLYVDPAVPDDLPDHRRRHGFDNLDFNLDEHGDGRMEWGGPDTRIGGTCLAEVPLPEYGIAAIRTGQFVVTEDGFHRIWEGEIRFE